MDYGQLNALISRNRPFRIETASGRVFDVPHRDFVSFSQKRTTLHVSFQENGEEHFAIVPLLTITAAIAKDEEGISFLAPPSGDTAQ